MPNDERLHIIRSLVFDYAKSPSLRHIRDPHFVDKLAKDILRAVDRGQSPWQKWEGPREAVLQAAARTWIPIDDLRDYLNTLSGPQLTMTDVAQRMGAMHEEGYDPYPDEDMKEHCLALYERERSAGTEMVAIVRLLQEFVQDETERRRREHAENYKNAREAEREALRERLISGADCKWTALRKPDEMYCRMNGRLYRVSRDNDKRWSLCRVVSLDDAKGSLIGRYAARGDASKVVADMAYQPEPRW